MSPIDWGALAARFDDPAAHALVLTGSHARGDANPYSDVDLVRFVAEGGEAESYLVDGHLVVVQDVAPDEVERWFVRPELAVDRIPGLREGRALRDRDGYFAALQARARAFVWDEAMQARADEHASRGMVGWIEEAHKALAGLRSGEIGRMLDGEFGLSWGLNRVVQVRYGARLLDERTGDWFTRIERIVGPDTDWSRLRRRAFGVEAGPLDARVRAGLRIYVATAQLLAPLPPIVEETVRLIERELAI